jgi:hypothetical protein
MTNVPNIHHENRSFPLAMENAQTCSSWSMRRSRRGRTHRMQSVVCRSGNLVVSRRTAIA